MLFDIFDTATDIVEDVTGISKETQTKLAKVAVVSATAGVAWGIGSEIADSIFDDDDD
jgi:hypothetical protein